jgi:type I restriction enzyme S subunit
MPEQREVASRVRELMALAASVEAAVGVAQRRSLEIEHATLARAFRGELVPQDPTDEPASALFKGVEPYRVTNKIKE